MSATCSSGETFDNWHDADYARKTRVELARLRDALATTQRLANERLALINQIELLLDGPNWTHEYEVSDDGWHIYCNGREDIRALINDWRAEGNESTVSALP